MLVDTGTTVCALRQSRHTQCGLLLNPYAPKEKVFLLTAGFVDAFPAQIAQLTLGEGQLLLRNLETVVIDDQKLDLKETVWSMPVLGILGVNALRQLGAFSIDTHALRVSPRWQPAPSWRRAPAQWLEDSIVLPIRLGRRATLHFLWDTGVQETILSPQLSDAELRQIGGRRGALRQIPEMKKEYDLSDRKLWLFERAALGEVALSPIAYTHGDDLWPPRAAYKGLLGNWVHALWRFHVNWARKELFIEPIRARIAGTYGLYVRGEQRRGRLEWRIRQIAPTDYERVEVLRDWTRLLAVDGRPVEQWQALPMAARLLFPQSDETVALRVLHQGKPRACELRAAPLIALGERSAWLSLFAVDPYGVQWLHDALGVREEITIRLQKPLPNQPRELHAMLHDYQWQVRVQ